MYKSTIKSGLQYIISLQEKDGGFASLTANNIQFANAKTMHTSFITSLVLLSLHAIPESKKLAVCKRKAATFLLSQKSEHWSWNYWQRNSQEAKESPYPDDLDATFCAAAALYQFDKTIIDGSVFAKLVMLLTAVEKKEGGPYATWLVGKNTPLVWKDIDIAVNGNIAYFLWLNEISLPNLDAFIDKHILGNTLLSPYYISNYAVIYFISRFYNGIYTERLINILISQQKNGYWDNPLDTAFAVNALLNLNAPLSKIKKAVTYLNASQRDGQWKTYPFINERIIKKQTFYCGSSALTTALCIQAMFTYSIKLESEKRTKKNDFAKEQANEKKQIYTNILHTVEKRFSVFDTQLVQKSSFLLDKLIRKDEAAHIPLLPYYFLMSFDKEKRQKIAHATIEKLGVANIYGWIAYTIYDDFFDKEARDPQVLSLANLALRELTVLFVEVLPKENEFIKIYTAILDTIDCANAWEIENCRFEVEKTPLTQIQIPDFDNLRIIADKSFGHCLGPLAILHALGYAHDSPEMGELKTFFTHFLIAKQLNDDAHDWENDVRLGQINPVSAHIIKKWKIKNKIKSKKNILTLLPELNEFFWKDSIDDICKLVFNHIEKAKKSIQKMNYIADTTYLESFLLPIERATQKAQQDKNAMVSFLATYHE